MTMKQLQRRLLDARIPAKIYEGKHSSSYFELVVRCRFRDRKRIKEVLEPHKNLAVRFKYRWTLLPWECNSLMKVVSYVD
jgi:hypothetical protein